MAKVSDRFASAHEMVREYQKLEKQMADPSIHEDQGKARQLGRRYAQLGPVVAGFNAWKSAADDLEAAREMARRCAREEGMLVGISSGATLAAIAQKLPELPANAVVLGFNYDTGERYLSVEGFLPA